MYLVLCSDRPLSCTKFIRTLIVVISSISKLVFVSFVLAYGREYLDKASIAFVIDLVVVCLFIVHLIGDRQKIKV